jgi:hypothetical protein
MIYSPIYQLPSIGAINPDAPQFLAGTAQALKEQSSASRIRNRSGSDNNQKQQTQGINQKVTFTPLHIFAGIKTPYSRHLGSLNALRIKTSSRWMFMAAFLLPQLSAQSVVDTLPIAAITPAPEVTI